MQVIGDDNVVSENVDIDLSDIDAFSDAENGDLCQAECRPLTPHLIRGFFKIARQKQSAGEYCSARRLFSFVAAQYEMAPHLKCCEIAQSAAYLARLAAQEEKYLEAEQYYIKALAISIDHLGENHQITAETFAGYGELLRSMYLVQEANVLELRADDIRRFPQLSQLPVNNQLKSAS